MRRTKIVCTIGPASESAEMIERLIKAGMNVARLNFSHGTHDEHLAKIKKIREISAKLGKCVGIVQDLSGPKIRIGSVGNAPVRLASGQQFTFTTREIEDFDTPTHSQASGRITCPFAARNLVSSRVHRTKGKPEISRYTSSCSRPGPTEPTRDRAADQSSGLRCNHRRQDLS